MLRLLLELRTRMQEARGSSAYVLLLVDLIPPVSCCHGFVRHLGVVDKICLVPSFECAFCLVSGLFRNEMSLFVILLLLLELRIACKRYWAVVPMSRCLSNSSLRLCADLVGAWMSFPAEKLCSEHHFQGDVAQLSHSLRSS